MPTHFTSAADGLVYLTIERHLADGMICAHWAGVQTLDAVQTGGLYYLELMAEVPCPRLLNDHTDVLGRFTAVNDWIVQEWMPLALRAGLRSVAQVLPPGAQDRPSVVDLTRRLTPILDVKFFTAVAPARQWLRTRGPWPLPAAPILPGPPSR